MTTPYYVIVETSSAYNNEKQITEDKILAAAQVEIAKLEPVVKKQEKPEIVVNFV